MRQKYAYLCHVISVIAMATTSDEDEWSPTKTPLKHAKLSGCIIRSSGNNDHLTRPAKSQLNLGKHYWSAQIWNHSVLIGNAKNLKPDEVSDIQYHSRFLKSYSKILTLKNHWIPLIKNNEKLRMMR